MPVVADSAEKASIGMKLIKCTQELNKSVTSALEYVVDHADPHKVITKYLRIVNFPSD